MAFELFEFNKDVSKDWDDFVKESLTGSIHQISDWTVFQTHIPGRKKFLGFGVKENNKITATVFCVQMQVGIGNLFWWYSARGPVFDPKKNNKAANFLMKEVSKKLKKTGGIFWRFDPYLNNQEFGFCESIKATQDYQPTDTLEIDLNKSENEILSEMKRKGRYNINLAKKKNLKVTKIENGEFSEKDLDDFWKLTSETTSRDGFSGHQKDYYRNFLKFLKKYAVLFFVESDGTRIATAISTFCASKAIYYFGASTSNKTYRNLMAPYLLQWEMINHAKEKKCKTYDFLGIAPENKPKHKYSGISEFKWKFGGSRKTYSHGQEIVFSKFWYGLYRLIKKIKG